MSRRTLGLGAFVVLAGGLGLAGFWLLFTSFKPYDDEGYVLISLANFAHGGRLYTDVFSQYGPFFYWWNDLWHHLLRFEFTNTSGRIVTLFHWLGAAALCAWIVDRQTRATGWALLALAATFAHLWQMTAEPMHPGGLITFAVALAAWAGGECIARDRARDLAIVVGFAGAALTLTKINVGVFLFAGAAMWLALNAAPAGPAVWRKLFAVLLVAMPWALMWPLLGEKWVFTFACIVSSATAGALIASRPATTPFFRRSHWVWLAGSAAVVAIVTCGFTLVRGTGFRELLEGVLLGPLHHPEVFSFAIVWRPDALPWSAVSLATCVIVHALGWNTHRAFVDAVVVGRIGLLVAAVLGWFALLPVSSLGFTLSYGLPAAWLLMVPLGRDPDSLGRARQRGWLGFLLLTQSLHAYPVGGSQIGWGTFLWAPLLIAAAAEAVAVLDTRWLRRAGALLALAAAFALAGAFAQEGSRRWHDSEPLRLRGAEALRLPEALSTQLRTVALNASVHAGQLFSLPGLFSFNLWTGRPTPTRENVTHWFSLLSPEQQQRIIDRLQGDPRAMIVIERPLVQFLRGAGLKVSGPLCDYLSRDFAPVFEVGDYALWGKRGRAVAPLSSARLYEREDPPRRFQLELCVLVAPGSRVDRVEWLDCTDGDVPRLRARFDSGNSTLEVAPATLSGAVAAVPAALPYPALLPQLARLTIVTREPIDRLPQRNAVLRLRDSAGALIAEAVFVR